MWGQLLSLEALPAIIYPEEIAFRTYQPFPALEFLVELPRKSNHFGNVHY